MFVCIPRKDHGTTRDERVVGSIWVKDTVGPIMGFKRIEKQWWRHSVNRGRRRARRSYRSRRDVRERQRNCSRDRRRKGEGAARGGAGGGTGGEAKVLFWVKKGRDWEG